MKPAAALFFIALQVGLASQAQADLARGLDLFERGRFDDAAVELMPLVEAGDRAAEYVLGVMYLNRMVEAPEGTSGPALIERAAEAGHLPAQTELARMYRTGDGVSQDFARMMKWYRRAAEQGDVGAQLFLADGYAYGYGVEPDLVEAYKWYEIAIQYWGPLAVRAREVIGERMTEAQIAEAVRRAQTWISAHAAE